MVFMRHGLQKRDQHTIAGFNFIKFCHKAIPDVRGSTRAFPVACTEETREVRRGEMYTEWGKLKESDGLEAKVSQSNLAATFRKNLLPSSPGVSSGLLNPGTMTCGKLTP
jgi:hypothetical protein